MKNGIYVAVIVLLLCATAGAQQTVGSMHGTVTTEDGEALPGVVVTVVHEPTGARRSVVSRADGAWRLLNLRVGGPYTATAVMTGFAPQAREDVFIKLGESVRIDFTLSPATIEEKLF